MLERFGETYLCLLKEQNDLYLDLGKRLKWVWFIPEVMFNQANVVFFNLMFIGNAVVVTSVAN